MRYSNPFLRLLNASRYSLSGFYYAFKNEQAFQYECVVFALIAAVSIFVPLTIERKIILIFSWLVVMCLELINSAVSKELSI